MGDVFCASAGGGGEHSKLSTLLMKNLGLKPVASMAFQRIKQIIASCPPYWFSYAVCKSKDVCQTKPHFGVHGSKY